MTLPPNILFIFSDQQHWQATGFQDASFQTPNLDRLAREGTVFTDAFCTTPQCSPSRSSMLTGLYPSKTGVLGNVGQAGGNALQMPTVGALLQRAGYRTAYFGKWHLGKDPAGMAGWNEDLGVTGHEHKDDPEVTRRAIAFLEQAGGADRPFALFLSYTNPHDIYHFNREAKTAPPRPRGAMTLPDTWRRKDLLKSPSVQRQFMTDDQGRVLANAEPPAWQRYRELYREKVKLYDDELGIVLEQVEQCGLLERTLVIVTSDHGDMDTQHGLIYKGPFMYEHMMRVPLVVRLPGGSTRSGGSSISFPTVNVDLVPTLADFAGADAPVTDGLSLKPLLTGKGTTPEREFVIGQYYSKQRWINPIRMIRTRQYKYNLYRRHGEELYDLRNDPLELHNLAADPAHADEKARLLQFLNGWIEENADPFYAQHPTTREGQPLA